MYQLVTLPERGFNKSFGHALGNIAGAIGSTDMEDAIGGALRSLVSFDRLYVTEMGAEGGCGKVHCAWSDGPSLERLNNRYVSGLWRQDPVQSIWSHARATNSQALLNLSSDDIVDPEYRAICYESLGMRYRFAIVEEMADRFLVVSLARRRQHFTSEDMELVADFAGLMNPLISRHTELSVARTNNGFEIAELERRFETTYPELTLRERQVCARTVAGITAEGTGIDIGIATPTVLTYRRRAYHKLGVVSASQLSSRILY